MSRSAWTTFSIPGLRILSATCRPSRRVARWTCEIDAEATGIGSIRAKTSEGGRPNSSVRIASASSKGNGRTSSRSDGELGRIGLGQEVGTGAEDLAELHEGRPKVLADHPESPGAVLGRDVVAQRDPLERPDNPFQMERRDHVLIAVAHQGRQDLAIPGQVAKMTDRFADQVQRVPEVGRSIPMLVFPRGFSLPRLSPPLQPR